MTWWKCSCIEPSQFDLVLLFLLQKNAGRSRFCDWAPPRTSFAICQLFSIIGNCSPRDKKITSSRSGIRMSVTMSNNRAVVPKISNIAIFGRVLQLQENWDLHMMTTSTKNIRNILTCEEKWLILSTITWWKGPKHFSNAQKKTFFFCGSCSLWQAGTSLPSDCSW